MARRAGHRRPLRWVDRVANQVLGEALKGWLGPWLGRRLAVLRYPGRRTGRARELVVQYVRDGDRVWVVPGHPDRKRWWRNLVEPAPVDLWLAGRQVRGVAVAVRAERGLLADALTAYRRAFPRAHRVADATVVVRVDLEGAEASGGGPRPAGRR